MRKLIATCVLTAAPMMAQAVIVEGSFSGTIRDSYDFADTFGYGAGDDTSVGQTISGTFRYDTDLAPADGNSGSNVGVYQSESNTWLNITFNINGSSYDISNLDVPGTNLDVERAVVQDEYLSTRDYISLFDQVGEQEFTSYSGGYVREREYTSGSVALWDYVQDLIVGDSLEQNFSWDSASATRGDGRILLGVYDWSYDSSAGYLYDEWAWVAADLNTFEIGVNTTDVPEPGSMALLGLGLAGIGFSKRKRKS